MSNHLPAAFYIDFSSDGKNIEKGVLGPFDQNGIPLVNYNKYYYYAGIRNFTNQPFGVHYTPVTIAIYAHSLLQKIVKDGSSCGLSVPYFFQLVDWLVNNFEPLSNSSGIWKQNFICSFEAGFKPPYPSGITQALAISLLLRAYQLKCNDIYHQIAHQAFEAFFIDVENGGVRCVDKGYIWIEEWPSEPRSHTLNGFMFALLSVHDYMTVFETKASSELWAAGIKTLENNLESFDCGYWSRYDLLRGLVVNSSYHKYHVLLLRTLYCLSGSNILLEYANRWEKYLNENNSIRVRIAGATENFTGNSEYRLCKIRQIYRKAKKTFFNSEPNFE